MKCTIRIAEILAQSTEVVNQSLFAKIPGIGPIQAWYYKLYTWL